MDQQRIDLRGQTHGGERPGPTAAHGICHGDAHGRGLAHALAFEIGEEFLQVINGDAIGGAAAGR